LKYSHCDRVQESKKLRNLYPNKIGVIVEPDSSFVKIGELDSMQTYKYILDHDYKMLHLMIHLRKVLFIDSNESMFLFAGDNSDYVPNLSETVKRVADKCISSDGFLYITFTKEDAFC
jgi:hypothetical protein